MPKKRKGARLLKSLTPYEKLLPYVMDHRYDAMVFFTDTVECDPIDRYIHMRRQRDGVELSYLDVVNAAIVRLIALRPALNRFVMGRRIYANNDIKLSMTVRKSLREGDDDTTIKLPFHGHETVDQVHDAFHEELVKNRQADREDNDTDKLIASIMNLPPLLLNPVVALLKWLDRANLLPADVMDFSPFHTSVYITYLKSLGIRSVYHHIFDFGTVSLFLALGKEQVMPVVDKQTGEVRAAKVLELKVVADERICDGLYYAKSMRLLRKILEEPEQLEYPLEKVEKDID
jgi:hypothetical protein